MEKSKLEDILNEPIADLITRPGSQPGDNVAGCLLSFNITTKSNQKIQLVHKSMAENPIPKDFAVKNQTFRIETAFYSKLAPALETFAKLKKHPTEPLLQIPKYYAGFNNDADDWLLLEDVRPDGFTMCDKYAGYDLQEASLVLKELAVFHASTYAFLKWEGEQIFSQDGFEFFVKNLFDAPDMKEFGMQIFNGAFKSAIELVAKRDSGLAQKMKDFRCDTNEEMSKTRLSTDKTFFPVIIFGDVWTNNIMMKYDSNGQPTAIKFIDFQLCRRGNIFEELQYFIFTSTTPVFRRKYLSQVLDVYYNSFVTTIGNLKSTLPIGFTKGFLIDSFRASYPTAFKYMAFAIPLQLGDPEAIMGPAKPESADSVPAAAAEPAPPPHFMTGEMDPAAMMAMQVTMMTAGMMKSMEARPAAIDRLYNIAVEMSELNII